MCNPNIDVLEEYINAKTKILHKYKNCGHTAKVPPYRVLTGSGCDICNRKNAGQKFKKTSEQYIKELKNKNPEIEPLEDYIGANIKIKHKHIACGHIWEVTPSSILCGTGCPKCGVKTVAEKNTLSEKDFKSRISSSITVLSQYINNRTQVTCQCQICSYIWKACPSDLMQGKSCPNCAGNIKKTHEQFMQDVASGLNQNIEIIGVYNNAKEPIQCRCKICNEVFYAMPYNLQHGSGCKKCINKVNGLLKRKSHDEFIKELQSINNNIKVLGRYHTAKGIIQVKCITCGYIWSPIASSLLAGNGCPKCANQITISHEDFIEKIKNTKNANIEVVGQYVNSQTPIECKCKICSNIYIAMPYRIEIGNGCKKCADKTNGLNHRKTHKDFVLEMARINPNIEIIGEYKTSHDRIKTKCLTCGYVWSPTADSLLHKNGCPNCSSSRLESITEYYLKTHKILYGKAMKYFDLFGVGKGYLSYDFYLPEYNLLIECQGEQHEHPVEYFGGIKKFVIQKIHDTRKRKYAHDHNIKLLEIWYYEENKINKILKQTLNNLKSECVETVIPA